jgi:uncharacterized protein
MEFKFWLLNEEKVKVHVPEVSQSTGFSCGAVALQAVFKHYGVKKSEEEMIKLLGSNSEDGTTTESLVKVARRFGFHTRAKHNMDISDLKKWLNDKKPVIVVMQAKGTEKEYKNYKKLDKGHYVVAIGYDKDWLYFEDPSSDMKGKRGKIAINDFSRRWKDVDGDNAIRYRWGLAVWKNQAYRHHHVVKKVKRI